MAKHSKSKTSSVSRKTTFAGQSRTNETLNSNQAVNMSVTSSNMPKQSEAAQLLGRCISDPIFDDLRSSALSCISSDQIRRLACKYGLRDSSLLKVKLPKDEKRRILYTLESWKNELLGGPSLSQMQVFGVADVLTRLPNAPLEITTQDTASQPKDKRIGPLQLHGHKISSAFFDDLRRVGTIDSDLPDTVLGPLLEKYSALLPGEVVSSHRQATLIALLEVQQVQVSIQGPPCIGSPYLYHPDTKSMARVLAGIDRYAQLLHIKDPDRLPHHARYHYLRNEICRLLGEDPLVEGKVSELLLACFEAGMLSFPD